MPSATAKIGFSYNYGLGENGWKPGYDENWVRADSLIISTYGYNRATTVGLTYGYLGGYNYGSDRVLGLVVPGTILLTDNTTNYVERHPTTNVVSKNVIGFTAGYMGMAKVITLGGTITSVTDARTLAVNFPTGGVFSVVNASDYGWIGDGASHPLSTKYATLAAAQLVYPHVTSLTQEIDWAAAQATINLFTNGRFATQNGEVWFYGVGLINTPLIYGGSPSFSLYLRGVAGQGSGNIVGTCFKWNGTTGTSMFKLQGACRSTIDGVNFSGQGGSGIVNCIHLSADNVVNTTLTVGIAAGIGIICTPVSMVNIVVGTLLGVDTGNALFELVYVTAVTGATFTADFTRPHLAGVQVGGGGGSSNCRIKNSNIATPSAAASAGILIGNPGGSMQVDLVRTNGNTFIGNNVGVAYAGIRQITGGNVKNFYSTDDEFFYFSYPYAIEAGSGVYNITNAELLGTTIADVLMLGTGHMIVSTSESESSGNRFLIAGSGGGTSPVSVVLINNSWECAAAADDIVIDAQCSLILIGNNILNSRTGTSVPIIKSAGLLGDNSPVSIMSIGNHYQHADDTSSVFYQGVNPLKNQRQVSTNLFRLFSFNDYGGIPGALKPLTPLMGPISMPIAGLTNQPTVVTAGLTFDAIGRINQTVNKVTIPFAVWSAAALFKDIVLFEIPIKTKIIGIYTDTTVALAGPAGTLNLRVGYTGGGQELILDHDVKTAPVTKGLVDADLGAVINRAAAVQGGWAVPAIWGGAGNLTARLTSSAGNLSTLTAGSITVYVIVERMF